MRRHFCWVNGFTALVCLRFAFVFLVSAGGPSRLQFSPRLVFATSTMLACAAVFAAAFWTTLKEQRSSQIWGVVAGSLLSLATTLPGTVTHHFVISYPFFFALGLAGVLISALPARRLSEGKSKPPVAVPGDFTNPQVNRLAHGVTLGLSLGAWFWWQSWLNAHHVAVFHKLLREILLSFAVLLIVTLIHESGHAAAGLACGMKLRAFFVGPFQWRLREGKWRIEFKPAGFLFVDGVTGLVPGGQPLQRREYLSMMAAGPISNVVAGTVALLVALRHEPVFAPQVNATLALIGVWSLSVAAANLIPYRTGDAYSDGAVVLQLLSDGALADLHLALARVGASLVTPTRPRDYDIEAIQRAAGEVAQGRQALLLWLLAFSHSLDSGKREQADEVLANAEFVCLQSASNIPAELHTTFVFGNALVRHDAKGARFWWNRMQARKPRLLNADYWRAASALYWIEGNLDEARCAWEKSNSLAAQLPKAGAYDFSRDCCALLRSELDRAQTA